MTLTIKTKSWLNLTAKPATMCKMSTTWAKIIVEGLKVTRLLVTALIAEVIKKSLYQRWCPRLRVKLNMSFQVKMHMKMPKIMEQRHLMKPRMSSATHLEPVSTLWSTTSLRQRRPSSYQPMNSYWITTHNLKKTTQRNTKTILCSKPNPRQPILSLVKNSNLWSRRVKKSNDSGILKASATRSIEMDRHRRLTRNCPRRLRGPANLASRSSSSWFQARSHRLSLVTI